MQVHGASGDDYVVNVDEMLPLERVLAHNARIASGAAGDPAPHHTTRRHQSIAEDAAVDLIAALVGPDDSTRNQPGAIVQADDFAPEPAAQAGLRCNRNRAG